MLLPLTLLTFLLLSLPQICHADLMNGLVGWWKLDETSGNAVDSSSQGNTGTLQNSPSRITGIKKGALSFDGTNQNVSIASSFGLSNANITIAGWCYRAALGDHGAFFKIGNNTHPSGGDGFAIGIGPNAGSGFEASGNNLMALYEGLRWIDTSLSVGTGWHHFALVINSSGYPNVFWDGVSVYSDSSGAPAAIGSTGASITQIGGYTSATPTNRFYTGYLDDIRIYNRALSATEAKDLYLGGMGRVVYGNNSVVAASKTSY